MKSKFSRFLKEFQKVFTFKKLKQSNHDPGNSIYNGLHSQRLALEQRLVFDGAMGEEASYSLSEFSDTPIQDMEVCHHEAPGNASAIAEKNAPPVIEGGDIRTIEQSENVDSGDINFRIEADDQENDSLTYSIIGGEDQDLFMINFSDISDGTVSFAGDGCLDYENPVDADRDNVYNLIVQVDDGNGGIDNQTVNFTVINRNENPVISSENEVSHDMEENSRFITTVTAGDPDHDQLFFSLEGEDADLFTINESTGSLRFKDFPDYENPLDAGRDNIYSLTVRVSDRDGGTDTHKIRVTVRDTNDAPVMEGGDIRTIEHGENVGEFDRYGNYFWAQATDQEGDSITYSIIGGEDQDLFVINPWSLNQRAVIFTGKGPLDYENPVDADRDNVYNLVLQADDGQGGIDTQAVNFIVNDRNDDPVISGGPEVFYNLEENSGFVKIFTARDRDFDDVLSYSLEGEDAGIFTIDKSTGYLQFKDNPDYENPVDADGDNIYNLTALVSDSQGGVDYQKVSVTVGDINDAPVMEGGDIRTIEHGENVGELDRYGNYFWAQATDQEGDSITYSIIGGEDQDLFMINPWSLNQRAVIFTGKGPLDYENPVDADGDNVYNLILQADDGQGGIGTQTVNFIVNDRNDNPVISGGPEISYDVEENSRFVKIVAGRDQDNDVLSYSLIYDHEDFPEGISFFGIYDFVRPYSLIGEDADLFTLDKSTGELCFKDNPDYENPVDADGDNVYSLTVLVSDSQGGVDYQKVSVTVGDINDAPVMEGGDIRTIEHGENVGEFDRYGNYFWAQATDQEGDSITYSIIGGEDQDLFVINPLSLNQRAVAFTGKGPLDYENPMDADGDNVYNLILQADDGQGGIGIQTVNFIVNDRNDNPVISGGPETSYDVEENSRFVKIVAGRDQDNDVLSYSLIYDHEDIPEGISFFSIYDFVRPYSLIGEDADLFTLDKSTGELCFKDNPDYENPVDADGDNVYSLTVLANDGQGGGFLQKISANVRDINDAPVIKGGDVLTIEYKEDINFCDTGNNYFSIDATDPDGDILTYSIIGGEDEDLFSIKCFKSSHESMVTGFVLNTDSENMAANIFGFDYENPVDADGDNVYRLTVRVDDGRGGTDTQAINVIITDTNDSPVISGGPEVFYYAEENGRFVKTVSAEDQDNDVLFYSLEGEDADLFTLDGSTGELGLRDNLDYESPVDADGDSVYSLTVRVDDGRGGTGTQTINVIITDTNDSPVISGGPEVFHDVEENGRFVKTVSAKDQDNDVLSYSLEGDDAEFFIIDQSTGEVWFKKTPDYEMSEDLNQDNIYNLTVRVDDGRGGTDTQDINVTVKKGTEEPTDDLVLNEGHLGLSAEIFSGREADDYNPFSFQLKSEGRDGIVDRGEMLLNSLLH